jgi:TonB family protein
MTTFALAPNAASTPAREIRYLDYLRALETLNAHRLNPAPPFALMLAFAFSLHVALVLGWTILAKPSDAPQEKLLQLRLGGLPELGAGPAVHGGGVAPTPKAANVPTGAEALLEEALEPSVQAEPRAPSSRHSVASSYKKPTVNPSPARRSVVPSHPSASPATLAPSAGTGGRGVKGGSAFGNSLSEQAEVIARYEQELSGWLERHKVYPESAADAGLQGRVIVRVQMNRQGRVLGSWIEQSSGHAILDKAVLAQVMRANPFPAAPKTYPGHSMLEFRFPVTLYIR